MMSRVWAANMYVSIIIPLATSYRKTSMAAKEDKARSQLHGVVLPPQIFYHSNTVIFFICAVMDFDKVHSTVKKGH